MSERDELTSIVDDRWHGYGYNPQGAADAILAAGYRKEAADGVMVDRLQAAVSAALALAQEWEYERANFEEIHDYSNYRLSVLNNAAQKLRDAIGSALRGQQ